MKLIKPFALLSSMLLIAGCANTAQGAKLTVENAKEYLAPFVEGTLNGNYIDGKVTFHIYPNSQKGKLFSPDIKGKCDVKVKYFLSSYYSEPYEYKNIEFVYKAGRVNESGFSNMDYLESVFSPGVELNITGVSVYDLSVTEISGHMLP